MREKLRFLGLDVHAETIAVAVAEPGWRGTQPGYDSQPRRVDPQVDQKAWTGRSVAGLLRSRPDGVCTLLATDTTGSRARSRSSDAGSEEDW
jgi:hypothetical protein